MKIKTPRTCPVCAKLLDAAAAIGENDCEPKDGDISICAYCGTVGMVDGDKLKPLTEEEVFDLPMDGKTRGRLIRAREAWEKLLKPRFGVASVQTRN